MFVTRKESNFWIHGNWCHGTVPDTAPGSAPLKAVFFLEQSNANAIEKMSDKSGVAHQLLRTLVQPILAPSGWEKTLDIIEGMVRGVNCCRVKFNLSGDICEMINSYFN
jgi:hypothetical protein